MQFGIRLSELRKKNKFSQYQLAEKLSVSEQTVRRWENGKSVPDSNQLENMCDIFGVPLNYFTDNTLQSGKDLTVNGEQIYHKSETMIGIINNKVAFKRKALIVIMLSIIAVLISFILCLGFISNVYLLPETTIYYAQSYSVNIILLIIIFLLALVTIGCVVAIICIIKNKSHKK